MHVNARVAEGLFARLMYLSLYELHEIALPGYSRTALATLDRLITAQTESRVKLR